MNFPFFQVEIREICHFSRLKSMKSVKSLSFHGDFDPSETTETRPVAVAPAPHLGCLALPGIWGIWASGKTDLIWLVDLPL